MSERTRVWVALLVVVGLASLPTAAQYTPASVSGTVADPTGAVIPGAKVVLIQQATNVAREQETTAAGTFSFERAIAGLYTLRASATGFQTREIKNLEVLAGKVTALGTLTLEVGATTQVVTVEATAVPLIQGDSPQITGNYTARQVTDTTFGFFGIDALAYLTPGVVPGLGTGNTGASYGGSGFGQQVGVGNFADISANGQRGRSTNFNLDGQGINDASVSGPALFLSNLDTAQEYQITTNQFSAEQGRNLGATVNILTKAGGNEAHGSVYWLHENSVLNSTLASESQAGQRQPATLIYNQGGFTLGGPVIKEKLFFFGGFDFFRLPGGVNAQSTRLAVMPAGFPLLAAAFPSSNAVDIYLNNSAFARPTGNPSCIPGSETTVSFAGVAVPGCRPQRTVPSATGQEEFLARLDYVGKKQSLWGRYLLQDATFCCFEGTPGNGFTLAVPSRSQSLGVTHSFQFSPRMLNEFRFNFTRLFVTFEGSDTFSLSQFGRNLTRINLPSPFLQLGLLTNFPQGRGITEFHFVDNWSLVTGRHTLKAGLEFRRQRGINFARFSENGAFTFGSTTDFVNNLPSVITFAAGGGVTDILETDQFYYLQDDIRLRPNLTLNLGIRYENYGQPFTQLHRLTLERERNPATALWLQTLPSEVRAFPRTKRDDSNWAPRLGFAYTPRWGRALFGPDKTVIRGGYGIAYEFAFTNMFLNSARSAPRIFTFTSNCSPPGPPGGCTGIPGTGTGDEVSAAIPVAVNTIDPRTLNQTRVARNFKNPYSQNWSLGLQRELGEASVLEVRYVGTRGLSLFQNQDVNPLVTAFFSGATVTSTDLGTGLPLTLVLPARPDLVPAGLAPCTDPTQPGFGGINCAEPRPGLAIDRVNSARSTYHGLQVSYRFRKLLNQLTGSASYTWSKAIDNVSEIFGSVNGFNGVVNNAQNVFDIHAGERGLSNLHLPHVLSVNAIWDTPWQREQQGWLGKVAGGWEISGTAFLYSGRNWTALQGAAGGLTSNAFGYGGTNPFCSTSPRTNPTCRPHLSNPNAPLTAAGMFAFVNGTLTLVDVTAFNNTGAVVPVTPNQVHWILNNAEALLGGLPVFGAGRNLPGVEGDGVSTFNFGIFKNTYIGREKRVNVQFRTMIINAFNHRNFGLPLDNADLHAGIGFADPVTSLFTDAAGRIIRFGLRVVF